MDVLYFYEAFPFQSKPCHQQPFDSLKTEIGQEIKSVKWNDTGNKLAVFFESQFILYERKEGTSHGFTKIYQIQTLEPWLEYEWIPQSLEYGYKNTSDHSFPFSKQDYKGPRLQYGLVGILILCKNGKLYSHQQRNELQWRIEFKTLDHGMELLYGAISLSIDNKILIVYQETAHITRMATIQCQDKLQVESTHELNLLDFVACKILSHSMIVLLFRNKIQLWRRDDTNDFFSNTDSVWQMDREHVFSDSILCFCFSNDHFCISLGLDNGRILQLELETWVLQDSLNNSVYVQSADFINEEMLDLFGDVQDVLKQVRTVNCPLQLIYSPNSMGVIAIYPNNHHMEWHSFSNLQNLSDSDLVLDLFKKSSIALLERKSTSDIAHCISHLSKIHVNLARDFLLKTTNAFASRLDAQYPNCSISSDDMKLLRLQLHIYRLIPETRTQFSTTFATIKLNWILESIYSSFPYPIKVLDYVAICLKNESHFETVLKDPILVLSNEQCIKIAPWIAWIMEFNVYLLRQAYIYFHSKSSSGQDYFSIDSSLPNALVFYFNTDLLLCLLRALMLVRILRAQIQNALLGYSSSDIQDPHGAILRQVERFISASHLKESSMIQFLKEIVGKETILPKSDLNYMFITSTVLESQVSLVPQVKNTFMNFLNQLFGQYRLSEDEKSWMWEPFTKETDVLQCLFSESTPSRMELFPIPSFTAPLHKHETKKELLQDICMHHDVLTGYHLLDCKSINQCMECGHFSRVLEMESCCCGGHWIQLVR